ncbi:hypothetical protein BTHI11S_06303 [Bosea thiooxidans]
MARALPEAMQVADRWHLMENASRAFLDAVRKSMRQIRRTIGATVVNPALLTAAENYSMKAICGEKRRMQPFSHSGRTACRSNRSCGGRGITA